MVYGNDPKMVLVEMLRRPMRFPLGSPMEGIMSLRKKFNSILNDAAEHYGYHRLFIEGCCSEFHYNRMGYLNNQGKSDFWKEVNNLLEKFDCRKINLLPKVDDNEKEDYLK